MDQARVRDLIGGLPLHHVGVAVSSIEASKPAFELVTGASCSRTETVGSQRVRVAFVGWLELIEPQGPESTIQRFLDRRGPGLHHVAYAVEDIVATLRGLEQAGVRLIDAIPRPGAFGHSVAFLHPSSTGGTLVELVETPSPREQAR